MKKLLVYLVLSINLIIQLSNPYSQVNAQTLETCSANQSYCDNGKWITKRCEVAPQYRDDYKIKDPDDDDKVCFCTYKQTAKTCDTLGGIPRETTDVDKIFGLVKAPDVVSGLGFGEQGVENFIQKAIQIIFIVAAIGFIFMVLLSALQMIFSGGDKEAIAKARGRLTWAIIGIVLLSLSFVIIRLFGAIVEIDLLNPNP